MRRIQTKVVRSVARFNRPNYPSRNALQFATYTTHSHKPARPFKPRLPQKSDFPPNTDFLFGIQPVLAALHAKRRTFHGLFIKQSSPTDKKDRFDKIEEISRLWETQSSGGQPKYIVDTSKLNSLVENKPHQGVVLAASPLEPSYIDFLTEEQGKQRDGKFPLWVALDQIQDPQNLGAIIRTCVYFGVSGIVTTDVRSSPLSPAASKASAGAMEYAPIYFPGNLSRFLRDSKANGWRVVGTAISTSPDIFTPQQMMLGRPTILVLGNEGKGVRQKVLEACDTLVTIRSADERLDSLNVSAATAVFIYQLLGR